MTLRPALLAATVLFGMAFPAAAETVALTHLRIVDGQGGPPVEDATVVMQDGRIVAAGPGVKVPDGARRLDRSGDTVLPGLISDHSHIGQYDGIATGPEHYTAGVITAELAQFRSYGVTTVTALGNNRPLFDRLREAAHAGRLPTDLFGVDQGIGVPNGAPPQKMTKSAADQMFRPTTPDEARTAVDRMADAHTDLVKIWVDDFAGSLKVKMQPEIIRAVVEESHRKGLRVAAHIHDLDDAEAVVADGADILAHGVRDKAVPAAFAATLKQRGIWYIPTLELDEATTAWAEHAPWTRTPFARAGLSPALARQIDDPHWDRANSTGAKADEARASLAMNLRNIRILSEAGVKIGFGTDSGATPVRVPGVAEHRELALLVQAGLTPLQAITIATRQAASLLELSDRGVIEPGRRADLLVVRGDPSRRIADVDQVVETWQGGIAVPGPG